MSAIPEITDPTLRRKVLGCSESAAALGVHPYQTRGDVWLEKTGRVDRPELDSGPPLWGTLLEEPVAKHWAKLTGSKIRRTRKGYRHPDHPFIVGHLDRTIVNSDRFLEVKTAGVWSRDAWGDTGTDQIPMYHRLQLAAYFSVTRFQWADVAVLIGGQEFRMYSIERDDDLSEKVVAGLVAFWDDYVQADVEPEPLSMDEATALFPLHETDTVIEANEAEVAAWREWHRLKAMAKETGELIDQAEVILTKRLELAATLHSEEAGQNLLDWKMESRATLDQRRLRAELPHLFKDYLRLSAPRVLRVKKPRKAKR